METITLEELSHLSPEEMSQRMDEFLFNYLKEQNPRYEEMGFLDPYTKYFTATAKYKLFTDEQKRKFLWLVFDFVIQSKVTMAYLGQSNRLTESERYKALGWLSPKNQIEDVSLRQAVIISNRIEFERFMKLIYFTDTLQNLDDHPGKSTFNKFKNYLLGKLIEDPFLYFMFYLPEIRKYDKEFRTAEVHDGSKFKKRVLALASNTSDIWNSSLHLTNLLMNLWRVLVDLMNDERANSYCSIGAIEHNWFGSYTNIDRKILEKYKNEIDEKLKSNTL